MAKTDNSIECSQSVFCGKPPAYITDVYVLRINATESSNFTYSVLISSYICNAIFKLDVVYPFMVFITGVYMKVLFCNVVVFRFDRF